MPLDAGKLQATLDMDTNGFTKGVLTAQKTVKRLGSDVNTSMTRPLGDAAGAANTAARAAERLGTETEDTTKEITDMSTVVGRLDTIIETMSTKTDKASKNVKDLGDMASESSKTLDTLKGVLGAVGITTGITGLIAAIKKIGTTALGAADDVDASMRTIAISTGASDVAIEKYQKIVDKLVQTTGYASAEVSQTLGTVATYNPGISNEQLEELTRQYQSIIGLQRTIGNTVSIPKVDAAFKKWGISVDDQADYLAYFQEIAEQTNIDIDTLTETMSKGDRTLVAMGMSAKEAAAYIGLAFRNGEFEDISALMDAAETLQAQKSTVEVNDESLGKQLGDIESRLKTDREAVSYFGKELNISSDSAKRLWTVIKDGDTAIELMGASSKDAAAKIRDMGFADTTNDVNDLVTAIGKLQGLLAEGVRSEAIDSEEKFAEYLQNVIRAGAAIGDENKATSYYIGELGIGVKVAKSLSAAVYANADAYKDLADEADKAKEAAADIDKKMQTADKQNAIITENMKRHLRPLGDEIQGIRDNLEAIVTQQNSIDVLIDLLNIRGWAFSDSVVNFSTKQIGASTKTEPQKTVQITQNFNVPAVDSYEIGQAAKHAQAAEINNPNNQ